MKYFTGPLKLIAASTLLLVVSTGCETTDGGNVSGSVYYGVGFYDPWYYGGYDDDVDIIVTPPDRPNRPDNRPRPEHPIVIPPSSSSRPMPSIPSTPRVSGGGGGGGRR